MTLATGRSLMLHNNFSNQQANTDYSKYIKGDNKLCSSILSTFPKSRNLFKEARVIPSGIQVWSVTENSIKFHLDVKNIHPIGIARFKTHKKMNQTSPSKELLETKKCEWMKMLRNWDSRVNFRHSMTCNAVKWILTALYFGLAVNRHSFYAIFAVVKRNLLKFDTQSIAPLVNAMEYTVNGICLECAPFTCRTT